MSIDPKNITAEDIERVLNCHAPFMFDKQEINFVDLRHAMEDRDIAELMIKIAVRELKDAKAGAENEVSEQLTDAKESLDMAFRSYGFWCATVKTLQAELEKADAESDSESDLSN